MLEPSENAKRPEIPNKRYFSIGEVSTLCSIKPHVLRYWEQEFPQLKPIKRRGNRRYYQREDLVIIQQISELLYGQGFTIGGALQQLSSETQAKIPSLSNAHIHQLRLELEEVLDILA